MPPCAISTLPGHAAIGAGERAALVPEELALDELRGQRRAVDGDERPGLPRRVDVDRAREQALAGARLAAQEHRRVGLRGERDALVDRAELVAPPDDAVERTAQREARLGGVRRAQRRQRERARDLRRERDEVPLVLLVEAGARASPDGARFSTCTTPRTGPPRLLADRHDEDRARRVAGRLVDRRIEARVASRRRRCAPPRRCARRTPRCRARAAAAARAARAGARRGSRGRRARRRRARSSRARRTAPRRRARTRSSRSASKSTSRVEQRREIDEERETIDAARGRPAERAGRVAGRDGAAGASLYRR